MGASTGGQRREGRGRLLPFPRPLPRPEQGLGILASPPVADGSLLAAALSADPSGVFLRRACISRVFRLAHPGLFRVLPVE
jgi:hypothetical protein